MIIEWFRLNTDNDPKAGSSIDLREISFSQNTQIKIMIQALAQAWIKARQDPIQVIKQGFRSDK